MGSLTGILPILRCIHLVSCGQVDQQLKAPHQTVFLFRHFRMNNPTGGLHQLGTPGAEYTRITHTILVLYVAIEHVGESTETAMWMKREARYILNGVSTVEMVEQRKRIVVLQSWCTYCAVHNDARTLLYRHRRYNTNSVGLSVHSILHS